MNITLAPWIALLITATALAQDVTYQPHDARRYYRLTEHDDTTARQELVEARFQQLHGGTNLALLVIVYRHLDPGVTQRVIRVEASGPHPDDLRRTFLERVEYYQDGTSITNRVVNTNDVRVPYIGGMHQGARHYPYGSDSEVFEASYSTVKAFNTNMMRIHKPVLFTEQLFGSSSFAIGEVDLEPGETNILRFPTPLNSYWRFIWPNGTLDLQPPPREVPTIRIIDDEVIITLPVREDLPVVIERTTDLITWAPIEHRVGTQPPLQITYPTFGDAAFFRIRPDF